MLQRTQASSSQSKKWKGWILGLQIANNIQLQLTNLFLLFWQKTTQNSNSSAASLCSPISASLPLVMESFFQHVEEHYGTSGTLNHWWFIKHIGISMDQLLWPSDNLGLWGVSLLSRFLQPWDCSLCTSLKAHTGTFSCCHQHRNHSKPRGQKTHPKHLEITTLQGQQTRVSVLSEQPECFQYVTWFDWVLGFFPSHSYILPYLIWNLTLCEKMMKDFAESQAICSLCHFW